MNEAPSVEAFLAEFHDDRPGLTSKAFAAQPVVFQGRSFASSYKVLAAVVPESASAIQVLDLACGDGFLLSLLADRSQPGLVLWGADISAGELGAAQRRLIDSASFVRSRAQHLPYESSRFDYVLCHLALMLMAQAEQVLREVRRVLKPGGKFAAIVGAPPPPSAARAHYLEALSRHTREPRWTSVRFGDERIRSTESIIELFSKGYTDVMIEDMLITLRLTPGGLWEWLLDMYDLYLLGEEQRLAVKGQFLGSVAAACEVDGKLGFPVAMRYIGATAA